MEGPDPEGYERCRHLVWRISADTGGPCPGPYCDNPLGVIQLIDCPMLQGRTCRGFEPRAGEPEMRSEEAERWFGVAPPDLSLVGRSKGADYIYSFLKGFYIDSSRSTGVNNRVLAGTSMPHVL